MQFCGGRVENTVFRKKPLRRFLPFLLFVRSPPYLFVLVGDNVLLKNKRFPQGALTDLTVVQQY